MKRPIAFIVETGSLSGGVRVIGELANRLADRDWEVSIWSPNPKETMAWFPISQRVKWHSFFRTGYLIDYEQLVNVLKKQDCIKVATYWRTAIVLNESIKAGEGYYLVQDVETSYTSQPIVAANVMATYEMPFQKFTTSKWVESQLKDTKYIGIGLDNQFRPPNKNLKRQTHVLACARIQALKGWDTFCEVARYLSQMRIPIKTYGVEGKLPIMVPVDHKQLPSDATIRRMLQEAGVFLSTSKHEGFNLTVLEAMATGTPVVTTDSNGNREYIQHEENCLVTNNPMEMAMFCYRLFTEKDLAKKLSENGPPTAARYRWKDAVDRLEKILLE